MRDSQGRQMASHSSGTTVNSWAVVRMRNMFAIILLGIMLGTCGFLTVPTMNILEKIGIAICGIIFIGIFLFLRSRTGRY